MNEQERGQVSNPIAFFKGVVAFTILFGFALWGTDLWLNWGSASTDESAAIAVAFAIAVGAWFSLYIWFSGDTDD